MTRCFFVSDLHGHGDRYHALFSAVRRERPEALFLGGDLLPHGLAPDAADGLYGNFLTDFLAAEFSKLREELLQAYPEVFAILGNDDGRWAEGVMRECAARGLWNYIPNSMVRWRAREVFGYAYVPPTPFMLKDWERYDVSRFVDPGCISPEEGYHSVPVDESANRFATIEQDLESLAGSSDVSQSVFLFHTPPYRTGLDRLTGRVRMLDHVPLDEHAGSVAVKRFIERRQPLITLHGHIHESARVTGVWKERIGGTVAISAAHDGRELALVRFSLEEPWGASRELVQT